MDYEKDVIISETTEEKRQKIAQLIDIMSEAQLDYAFTLLRQQQREEQP
jgi:hypothetical protein